MVGGKFVPPTLQASVKFLDFVEQYLCSLLNLVSLLISRRSFPAVSMNIRLLVLIKT